VTGPLAGGLLLSPLALGSADAHVTVSADVSTSGAYSALTFRVPSESDEASTTAVSVQLPQDTPFSSVRTRPVPGWTAKVVRAPLPRPVKVNGATLTAAVRTVTWTADDDAAIGPDQYQEFSLAVGPLPAPSTIPLPATQTYSDGEVVRWDDPAPASGEEPEHAAPVLEVVEAGASAGGSSGSVGSGDQPVTGSGREPAGGSGDQPVTGSGREPAGGSGDQPVAEEPVAEEDAPADTSSDGTARWLGGAALTVAVLAAGAAGLALGSARSGRRR
jgi:uncharacterized protein YcnI